MRSGHPYPWLLGVAVVAVLAWAAGNQAQDQLAVHTKPGDLNQTLKEVIDAGATLYNGNDHAGSYRIFQGALLTVRPFLRPDLHKVVDDGLQNAAGQTTYARRAWELRKVLDTIRTGVKPE